MRKAVILVLFLVLLCSCHDKHSVKGSYSVEYKTPDGWFWHRLENCNGDGIVFDQFKQNVPVRYFTFTDNSRIELPMTMMIRFDQGRFNFIEDDIRRQTGR
jgi:hypothetical protein